MCSISLFLSSSDKKPVDLSKPMKMGAFVDFNRTRKYSEDDYILPETPPFSWLLRKQEDANNNSDAPPAAAEEEGTPNNKENENSDGDSQNQKNQMAPTGSTAGKKAEEQQQKAALLLNQSQRPSRWSVSPTMDEEKFLKELVGVGK